MPTFTKSPRQRIYEAPCRRSESWSPRVVRPAGQATGGQSERAAPSRVFDETYHVRGGHLVKI